MNYMNRCYVVMSRKWNTFTSTFPTVVESPELDASDFLCHFLAKLSINSLLTLSDQGVKLLKEVMERSDIIRYRVFDVIIDSILISDQAFEFANGAGFIPKILEVCGLTNPYSMMSSNL